MFCRAGGVKGKKFIATLAHGIYLRKMSCILRRKLLLIIEIYGVF